MSQSPRDLGGGGILILGGTLLTMNDSMEIVEDAGLAIEGGSIVAVGTREAVASAYSAARILDASGKIVMPGLVNTHTHTPMVVLRGFRDDMALDAWLDSIVPWEKENVNPESVRINSTLAMAEMIRSGTTTFSDMYFYGTVTARLAREVGMRAVVCEPYAEGGPYGFDYALRAFAGLVEEFAGDRTVVPALGPHSLYTCTREQLLACAEESSERGTPLVIHLAETESETRTVLAEYGRRPVGCADELGLLTDKTVAAHCVHVDAGEIALMADRGVSVSHMPQSNMKLVAGIAPVLDMLAAGVTVGLATDGPASNNTLDMFQEIKSAALVQKVICGDPAALDAATVARMATVEGARALGLGEISGSLEPGKRADVITLDLESPHMTPCYNPLSHVAYVAGGCDVDTAVVEGRVLMENRELLTIDVEKAIREVRDLALGAG